MKLYYAKDPIGNFGDDFNLLFWENVWPEYVRSIKADWLVGIGSILTGALNQLPGSKLVMGSGYWPTEMGKPDLTPCYIGFVRGPLSCRELGLEDKFAITDPAVLVSTFISRPAKLNERIGFMPHHSTHNIFDCAKIAKMAGLLYIDPTAPVQNTLNALIKSPKVLVEAMHGAIVADAMGVPWQRISIFNVKGSCKKAVDFKWQDWGQSLGIETESSMECLLPWPGRNVLRQVIKRPYLDWSIRRVVRHIRTVMQDGEYRLSNRELLSLKIEQLHERIDSIKTDYS